MFTIKHYINITALLLASLINSFFLYKIAAPLTSNAMLFSVIFFLIFSAAAVFIGNRVKFAGKTGTLRILLLIVSPAVYHLSYTDFRTLSTAIILIIMLLVSEKYMAYNRKDLRFFVFSILFGLLLAESYSAMLVYIIFVLYFFRYSLPAMGIFAAVTVIVLCILSLMNMPAGRDSLTFVLQSFILSLPFWSKLLLVLIALYLGWIAADIQEVMFASGLVTFFLALSLTLHSLYDIIYYSLAAVFLIFSIKDYKVDRFLGKVMEPEGLT